MVNPKAKKKVLHPEQLRLILEVARKSHNIGPDVARPYIDQVAKDEGITIEDGEPPELVVLPDPVENLSAESLDGQIRLRWQKPKQNCEVISIARSETGSPKPTDRREHVGLATEWVDTKVEPGKRDFYGVFTTLKGAADASGRFIDACGRSSVRGLQVQVEGMKAVLTWTLPAETRKVLVLRGPTKLTNLVDTQGRLTVPPDARRTVLEVVERFEDAPLKPNQTYHYAVVACHDNDVHSVRHSNEGHTDPAPLAPQGLRTTVVPGRNLRLLGPGRWRGFPPLIA